MPHKLKIMATFEDVRLIDLVDKFQRQTEEIYTTKNLSGFTKASKLLQGVYDFYITAQSDFKDIEEYLKNLFSSFNYAAVIINDGLKNKGLDREANELLFECLQIMLRCCGLIREKLSA
ncbi:MAG: hypothetical protein ACI4L9_04360 [Candidatus Coproplasma sp.]